MKKQPIRIQFTLYNILQAEVIVENYDIAKRIEAAFYRIKWRRNLLFGGSIMQLASLPRYFNIPVGSVISEFEYLKA